MKNKTVAAVLAIFFGSFGAHKFYLRDSGGGIFYLFLLFMSSAMLRLPVSISTLLGFIDAFRLFTMSEEEFDRKYNRHIGRNRNYRSRRTSRREYQRDIGQEKRFESKRERPISKRPAPTIKANPFKKSGIRKYKEFELEEAIEDFKKGLEIEPRDQALHFNIACAYSLTEQKDKAYHHLEKAVEYGFKDFNRIDTHDDLAYVRIQEEFDAFKEAGYKRTVAKTDDNEVQQKVAAEPNLLDDDVLLSQLNKLAELRKKGLLSENEFQEEKKKLLRK